MPAGREGQRPVVPIDAAYIDGNRMAGKPVFHLDGEMVGIALEFGRQYLGTKDDNVRVVFFERPVEGEGQGTGKSVEDEVLVGKHRLDTVHLPAKFKLALRNAIGEGARMPFLTPFCDCNS